MFRFVTFLPKSWLKSATKLPPEIYGSFSRIDTLFRSKFEKKKHSHSTDLRFPDFWSRLKKHFHNTDPPSVSTSVWFWSDLQPKFKKYQSPVRPTQGYYAVMIFQNLKLNSEENDFTVPFMPYLVCRYDLGQISRSTQE